MAGKNQREAAAAARAAAGVDPDELARALTAERVGYERRGLKDRVKQVDEQLKALGGSTPARSARGQQREAESQPQGNPPIKDTDVAGDGKAQAPTPNDDAAQA